MIKRQLFVFITAASLLVVVACNTESPRNSSSANDNGATKPTPTPDPFAATRATYAKDCQECHGATGAGGPTKLSDGSTLKVPTLREGSAVRHADTDLEKQITKGGDGMPAFADKLKPAEITEMIRFIRKEFQGK